MTKSTPEDEFAEAVMGLEPIKDFKPTVTYIPEGDCLECVFSTEDYRAERIDGRITVYRGRESRDVVGVVIKGFRHWLSQLVNSYDGIASIIHTKTAKLEYVLLAHVLRQPKVQAISMRQTYRRLLEKAEETNVEVPFRDRDRVLAK